MAVSFVATGTAYTTGSFGNSFTLNKPAGVADGDVMVAMVAFYAFAPLTITCTGWTVVQTGYGTGSAGNEVQVTMLVRTATASEPSSWTANSSLSTEARLAIVSAYRGVQTVGASGQSGGGSGTSRATASVSNTTAGAWRVVHGAYVASSSSPVITSNETIRRAYTSAEKAFYGWAQAAIWDSNGSTVAVGSTSRTVSRSSSWYAAATAIVLLYPSTGTPATGALAATAPAVEADAAGVVNNPGVVDVDLWVPDVVSDGYGQPPLVSGSLSAPLPLLGVDVAAAHAAFGPLDVAVPIIMTLQAETRVYGVRVIRVEADDRTIRVESRGVAD